MNRVRVLCLIIIGVWAALPLRGPAGELQAIGVSVSDLGNPFYVEIGKGTLNRARSIAGESVSVRLVSSAYDLDRQIRQIEAFVASGVDLIILSAADAEDIAPSVRRAQAAGVRVIAVDVDAAGADATITTDNDQAGRVACRAMAERLEGEGDVVIINGPQVSSTVARVAGCRAVLAEYPDLRLLSDQRNGGGSRQGGLEKMTDLMTAFDRIDAVFAINDPTALGAEEAARQAGRDDFFIVSVDGAPSVIERLGEPDTLIHGTSAQFPRRMARRAVEIGAALLAGETPSERVIRVPARFVTAEDRADYPGWGAP